MRSGWNRLGWLLRQPSGCAASFDPLDGGIPIGVAKSGVIQLWNTREYTARENSRAASELMLERHVLLITRAAKTDVQTRSYRHGRAVPFYLAARPFLTRLAHQGS